jgi:GGDEF domain-containing protein
LLESCWFAAVGLGCAATIVAAEQRRNVPAAAAWRWFALGIALNSLRARLNFWSRLRPVTPAGQTFSAGVATWDSAETSDELIARADRALYLAKQSGRNRTVVDGAAVI